MKRGRIYACARREGYNVLALGQHLDDLCERYISTMLCLSIHKFLIVIYIYHWIYLHNTCIYKKLIYEDEMNAKNYIMYNKR